MSTQPIPEHSTQEWLAIVRDNEAVLREAEIHKAQAIVGWAKANTVTAPADAATICEGRIDTGLPIAREGAPLVSEFALMELCAVLGRSTASGRNYVGQVIETAFRLPGIWEGVTSGRVPVWRACKIADTTRVLSAEAAEWVDHHLANFAGSCTFAQVDRLVEEALVRFDPETAEERRREAAERRHFDVDTRQVSFDGTVHVEGELDLADGLDLDAAIGHRAQQLGELGCEESLNVRRSMAAGELARHDHTLNYEPGEFGGRVGSDSDRIETQRLDTPAGSSLTGGHSTTKRRPGRKVELHVHLTDTALAESAVAGAGNPVGRCGNTQTPISPDQIREWCATPGTTVTVRPVIDLASHDPIDSYEIPDRHRRQVLLRDKTCAFPYFNQRASRCDLDHRVPHARGGPTCPCNLVPLCRSHHRAKTHAHWRYVTLDPGTYLWTSPAGYQYLVNARGTRDLSDEAVVSRLASSHLNHRHQP